MTPDKYLDKVEQYEKLLTEQLASIYKKSKEGTKAATKVGIQELASELGTNDVFGSFGLKDDAWETYIIFLETISKTLKNFLDYPDIEVTKERVGLFLRKAYIASISYANQHAKTSKGKIKNLWDKLGFEKPLPAYTNYVRQINEYEEDEYNRFWTRHKINEFNDRSIFSNTDKLKIMNAAIESVFLISNLKYYGYLKSYFPLHNEYEMSGMIRDEIKKPDDIETDLCKAMGKEVYEYIEPEKT